MAPQERTEALKQVTGAILLRSKRYGGPQSIQGINYGWCACWAILARRVVGGQLMASNGHVILAQDGLYFDSTCPEGVGKYTDLPYYQKWGKEDGLTPVTSGTAWDGWGSGTPLGVPPFSWLKGIHRPGPDQRGKLDRYRDLLGVESAVKIAALAGCSRSAVQDLRAKMGVLPPSKALRRGILTSGLLGKQSPAFLAKHFGCSEHLIRSLCKEAGVRYRQPSGVDRPTTWKVDWGKFDSLMGTMSDDAVAALAGCSGVTVTKRRNRKGVPPFCTRRKK